MSEQLSFLPPLPFCPLLPPHGSTAEQALCDLMERDLTQLDWIAERKSWRLAAAIKELGISAGVTGDEQKDVVKKPFVETIAESRR